MEKVLDRETKNRIGYINFIILRFARGFKMLIPESFRYLDQYGGQNFLYKNYEYEHTQSERRHCGECRNDGRCSDVIL